MQAVKLLPQNPLVLNGDVYWLMQVILYNGRKMAEAAVPLWWWSSWW